MTLQLSLFVLFIILGPFQLVEANPIKNIDLNYRSAQTMEDFKRLEALIKEKIVKKPGSFSLNWRLVRTLFALGEKAKSKEHQICFFNRCMERAELIIKTSQQKSEGYYFKALCQGRRGQITGLLNSISAIAPFKKAMETAAKLDPYLEEGGPHRALGRLYQDLPIFLGGNLKTAIKNFKLAVKYGPHHPENHLFLARALYENERIEEAEKSLNFFFLIESNPEEKKEGRELLKVIQTRLKKSVLHDQRTHNQ